MPLDPSPPLVVARRGQKHPSAVSSGDKSQITVLSCCSAVGYAMAPFVIFDRKFLRPELTVGEVLGTVYGLSKKGWIDGELFESRFTHHFLARAAPVRPTTPLDGRTRVSFSSQCYSEGSRGGNDYVLSPAPHNPSHAAFRQRLLRSAEDALAAGMLVIYD